MEILKQFESISGKPEYVFVDMGYRGHGYGGDIKVHVNKRKRDRTVKSMRRWMKRRMAIEPDIGHLEREHRMDRNGLYGIERDCINAILSAAEMNVAMLLKWLVNILGLVFRWLFG